jgi:hypothetical protein
MRTRLIASFAIVSLAMSPASAEPRSFPLLTGRLELEVPDGWKVTVNAVDSPSGPAFQFVPPGNVPLLLLVTPIPVAPGRDVTAAAEEIAQEILQRTREVAVEKDLAVRTLEGDHCRVFYVSATDRTVDKPSLEDFKYGDQGAAALDAILITFTVLTNVKDGPERTAAIDIVRSARHTPARDESRERAAIQAVGGGVVDLSEAAAALESRDREGPQCRWRAPRRASTLLPAVPGGARSGT